MNLTGYFRTADAGRSWTRSLIPFEAGDFPRVTFVSPDAGWVADGQGAVFRTVDGGATWQKSQVPSMQRLYLRDLHFLDRDRGWLLAEHTEQPHLFATTDGGRSWQPQAEELLRGRAAFWVAFLDARLGFVGISRDDAGSALLYTLDGGGHWRKLAVPHFVGGCQGFDGDLLCSASSKARGLIVLRIHPR